MRLHRAVAAPLQVTGSWAGPLVASPPGKNPQQYETEAVDWRCGESGALRRTFKASCIQAPRIKMQRFNVLCIKAPGQQPERSKRQRAGDPHAVAGNWENLPYPNTKVRFINTSAARYSGLASIRKRQRYDPSMRPPGNTSNRQYRYAWKYCRTGTYFADDCGISARQVCGFSSYVSSLGNGLHHCEPTPYRCRLDGYHHWLDFNSRPTAEGGFVGAGKERLESRGANALAYGSGGGPRV